jgi:molybdopterin-guanine dinucleotide biosynthesis protein A
MPSPSPSIIRHLCSFAAGFDAVVPLTGQGFEPLFALYRKTCLEPMKRHLDEGNLRVYDIYPEICARYVTEAELDLVQGGARSLININTPEELARFKENR